MFRTTGLCALAALLLLPAARAQAADERLAIWGTTPASAKLAAALTDVLSHRPNVKLEGALEAPEWFMGCSGTTSDPCVQKVARSHHLKAVIRVWASMAGGKLAASVDLIDTKAGPAGTYQDQGLDDTPEALHAAAERATAQLFGGGSAQPQVAESPQDAEAKAHFKAAREAYHQADYATAIKEFEAAYAAKPSGVIRYNIAQADEKLGNIPGALLEYHRYLHETPNAEDRATVEKAIANLEKRLQERGVQQLAVFSQPSGAAVTVDGKPRGATPLSIELAPGEHEVELQLSGYQTSRREVSLSADKSVELDVALSPGTNPPQLATNPPNILNPMAPEVKHHEEGGTNGMKVAAYATGGVGVALLAVGVVEGLQVSSKNSDEQTAYKAGDFAGASSAYASAKSAASIANVTLVAGGALLATDAVLFFLSPSDTTPTASVGVSDHGASVAIAGHF